MVRVGGGVKGQASGHGQGRAGRRRRRARDPHGAGRAGPMQPATAVTASAAMRRTRSTVLGTLLLALAAGCGKAEAPPTPGGAPIDPAAIARGKAIIAELKASLLARLQPAMQQGAASAIAVCNVEAPAIAAAQSRDGVVVGRATRKPRNPANLVFGWRVDAIAEFEARHAARQLAGGTFARRLDDGRIAVAEPLVIQELCTTCHGTSIAPDVQAVLAERYPADLATGYAVGDLRGLVW